jgi:hypothetical protein
MTVVNIKQLSKPAATLLDLARALADYMAEGTHNATIETASYEERLQISLTLRQMVMARREDLQCATQ